MHNYAYFEFSGIFLIFLGPIPSLPPPKRIRIPSPLVFGPGSITHSLTHTTHTNRHYTSSKYRERFGGLEIFLKMNNETKTINESKCNFIVILSIHANLK